MEKTHLILNSLRLTPPHPAQPGQHHPCSVQGFGEQSTSSLCSPHLGLPGHDLSRQRPGLQFLEAACQLVPSQAPRSSKLREDPASLPRPRHTEHFEEPCLQTPQGPAVPLQAPLSPPSGPEAPTLQVELAAPVAESGNLPSSLKGR